MTPDTAGPGVSPDPPALAASVVGAVRTENAVTMAELYSLPEGTVLYKPDFGGWTLFIRDEGYWRIVDAFDRDQRGKRYSPAAVGCFSPGYVIHQPPEIGYYESPAAVLGFGLQPETSEQ